MFAMCTPWKTIENLWFTLPHMYTGACPGITGGGGGGGAQNSLTICGPCIGGAELARYVPRGCSPRKILKSESEL